MYYVNNSAVGSKVQPTYKLPSTGVIRDNCTPSVPRCSLRRRGVLFPIFFIIPNPLPIFIRAVWSEHAHITLFEISCGGSNKDVDKGPPGALTILGECLFIFRDLGSTGNYFKEAGEQAHSFGDLGSPTKKQKINKGKA